MDDDTLTPGSAVECDSCGAVTPVSLTDRNRGVDCPECGDVTTPVEIEACPNGDVCDHDSHDWARGVHVISVG